MTKLSGRITNLLIGAFAFLATQSALSNPVLNNVGAGNVSFSQSPNTLTIHQNSPNAILNWRSFNINKNEATHFLQPAGGIALNRISPTSGASQIYGVLTATGRIILINTAGIYFGPSAYVNVGGLIATTANISDKNFLHGNYVFEGAGLAPGSIVNAGTIIAANHGLVALVGSNVTNNGLIQANLGHVVLSAGDAYTMSFAGNDLINFTITKPTNRPRVTNNGRLIANGGQILVSAASAHATLDNVINMNGVAEAKSVYAHNGEIIISGDPNGGVVRVAGNINVSGRRHHQTGGTVHITGQQVVVDGANIDASGDAGGGTVTIGANPISQSTVFKNHPVIKAEAINSGHGGLVETSGDYLDIADVSVSTLAPDPSLTGTWLLDPTNIYIAANQANATAAGMTGTDSSANTGPTTFQASGAVQDSLVTTGTLQTALASNNILVTTTNASGTGVGNLTVVDPITWSAATSLSLTAANNMAINNAITGSAGSLILNAGGNITTSTAGAISVKNFNLASGFWNQVGANIPSFSVSNDFQIASGSLPSAIASFIRASSGNGTVGSPYVINDAYGLQGIASNATNTLGATYLQGQNIDLTSTANWNGGVGFRPIGSDANPFVGNFNGQNHTITNLTIDNAPIEIALFGVVNNVNTLIQNVVLINPTLTASGGQLTGPLVGWFRAGTVSNSSSTGGSVTANSAAEVGGLVSFLAGATITNSSSSTNVTGAGSSDAGGLVGLSQSGSITNSSASGHVTITNVFSTAGGLVGQLDGTSLSNSSASGTVTGFTDTFTGGLVGWTLNSAPIINSFATGDVSATGSAAQVGGLVGENSGVISGSHATGNVSGISNLGGLVGENTNVTNPGTITTSYASGTVTGTGSNIGGLVGFNDAFGSTITASTSSATVNGVTNVGGIAGYNNGTISTSYNTGLVTGTSNFVGGVVGLNDTSGTISDSYNLGQTAGGPTFSGGIAGGNNGSITRVFNAGWVDNNAFGGGSLIGTNSGSITNSFYDTNVSFKAAIANDNGGSSANITGGVLGPSGPGVDLSQSSTFTPAPYNWDFSTVWNINPGQSYPYLRAFYSTAPQIFTGLAEGNTFGDTLQFVVNGVKGDKAFVGSNTQFYFQEGANLVTGTSAIPTGAAILIYTPGGSAANGTTVLINPAGGISLSGTDLVIFPNTLVTGFDNVADTGIYSNSVLAQAKGPLSDTGILYTVTGNNLALTSNTSYQALSNTNLVGNITTSGTGGIFLVNGITQSADAALTTAGGTISLFSDNANNHSLSIVTSGIANIGSAGNGGSILQNLSSLSFDGGGTYNLNSFANTYSGSTTINTGTLSLNDPNALGNTSQTTVDSGATLLLNAASLTNTNPIILNGGTLKSNVTTSMSNPITLTGANPNNVTSGVAATTFTLNGAINGASQLVLNGPGSLILNGNIGQTTAITSLLENNTVAGLTLPGSIKTSGNQTYNTAVILGASGTYNSTGGSIDFTSTLDGAHSLTINSNGTTTFGNTVGGTTPLTGLDVTASAIDINTTGINTSGNQRYRSTVNLGASPDLITHSGTMIFDGAVNGAGQTLTLQDATAASTGAVTFNGNLSLANLVTFGSPANYTVSLLGSSNTFTSPITFNNTGTISLGNSASDVFNFNSGFTHTAGTTDLAGALNTTNNAVSLGAVVLGANSAISTGTGAITLGALSGGFGLQTTSSTGATLNGVVNIASLALTGGGTDAINSSSVSTTGAQTYSDALNLGAGITFGSGSTIAFNNTLNGAQAVVINSTGTTTFSSPVGAGTPLTSLDVTASGINLPTAITTSGLQRYRSPVTLTGATSLTGTALTFDSTINGAFSLQTTASTGTSLGGAVNIASLTLGGGGTDSLASSITTSAGQTYNDAVSISGPTSLSSGGAVLLNAINGANTLTINSTNATTLAGAIGGVTRLTGLDITAGGGININTTTVATNGTQHYRSAVTLGASPTLSSRSGSIIFDGTVTGAAQTLTLQDLASTGSVIFNNDVTLGDLTTVASNYSISFLGSNYNFTNPMTFNNTGALTLGNNSSTIFTFVGGLNHTSGATDVAGQINTTNTALSLGTVNLGSNSIFNSGTGALTLGALNGAFSAQTSSANTTLNGPVNIASLTMNGVSGTININTNSIHTTGSQTYNTAVNLNTGATFSGGPISFNDTLDGANNLNVSSSGGVIFGGVVGGGTPLASLVVSGTSATISGGAVTTSGAQTYNAPLILGNNTALNGSSVALNQGINNGNGFNLSLNGNLLTIIGTINALNTATINGTGSNNSFLLNTGGTQNWLINSASAGSVGGISGVSALNFGNIQHVTGGVGADSFNIASGGSIASLDAGGGTNTMTGNSNNTNWTLTGPNAGNVNNGGSFSNIQNIIGGNSNSVFTLAGGSLSGGITGGSGVNTLVGSGTFNITGLNSGGMPGLGGGFSNMQNISGTSASTYRFSGTGQLSGTLNGGGGTLNFNGIGTPVVVNLADNKFNGSALSSGHTLVNYTGIGSLVANAANGNTLNVTPAQLKLTTLSRKSKFNGQIADPLFFSGFTVPGAGTVSVIPSPLVSPIIQQGSPIIYYVTTVNGDVDGNLAKAEYDYDAQVDAQARVLKINPYCSATAGL